MAAAFKSYALHALMGLLALLALALLALELGAWTRAETHRGPFAAHAEFPGVHVLAIGRGLPLRCCLTTGGDSRDRQDTSRATLTVNGVRPGPAHRSARQIAMEGSGFGHWGNEIHFALSAGLANDMGTTAEVRYRVAPRHFGAALPAALALLLALHLHGSRIGRAYAARLTLLPAMAALAFGWLLLAASTLYIIAVLATASAGEALPLAAPFRWHALAGLDRTVAYALLCLAVLGGLAAHARTRRGLDAAPLARAEERLLRFARLFGLPLSVVLALLAVSAPWTGQPQTGELTGASIAGLIPFNDANGYFSDALDIQRLGYWSDFSARRPLAAAFRTFTLLAGGNSYAGMLIVQSILVAAAAFLAAAAVVRWRGLWAGTAFFAICHIIVRPMLPTALTEPLGFFWALLAVPFLVSALRSQSLLHGLTGLALLTLALFTRMGAMFAIPALALWLVWRFGRDWPSRARIAMLALAVFLLLAGANTALQRSFAEAGAQTASNFAYTLCGLSVGDKWTGCLGRYDEERKAKPELSEEAFLYRKALDNILAQPHIFAGRLAEGAGEFAMRLPLLLMKGVDKAEPPAWFPGGAVLLIAVWGLAISLRRLLEPGEAAFWVLLGLGTLASAGFVYFDAGQRVMIAIYPLAALLLVSGLGGVRQAQDAKASIARSPAGLLAAAVFAAVLAAPVWSRFVLASEPPAADGGSTDTALIAGGRRLTGFLIVPDDAELPRQIPAFRQSRFRAIALTGFVEDFQPLVTPPARPLPFGLVTGPRLEPGVTSGRRYIVPAEVLLRQDVEGWRLHLAPQTAKSKTYWTEVLRAEPLPAGE